MVVFGDCSLPMRLSGAFALVVALVCVRAAAAQTSVYGELSVTNYGYTVNGGNLAYSSDHVGGTFGGFYNFPIQSRLTAGLDAHVGFGASSSGGVKGFVSARFGVVPVKFPLRPYLEVGGGFVSAHVPRLTNIVGPQTITSGALELGLGVDLRLTRTVDWRLIEFEGGGGGGTKAAGSGSVSTGVVYHFPSAGAKRP